MDPDGLPTTSTVTIVARRIENLTNLEVVVFDARGAPEPEAEVRVNLDTGGAAPQTISPEPLFTGADGRTVFESVPEGVYSVVGSAAGSDNSSGWQRGRIVAANGLPVIVDMLASPLLAPLSGRLLDNDGRPVRRAILHASGSVRGVPDAWTLTEADGSFRFAALAAGDYLLKIQAEGLPDVLYRRLLTVSPSGLDNVEVRIPEMRSVFASVVGLRPWEFERLQVSARTQEESASGARQRVSVDGSIVEDGRVRIDGMDPGEWTITARVGIGRSASTNVTVAETDATPEVTVALPAGFTLRGNVQWRGDPPETATVSVGGRRSVEFDPRDSFEVFDLPPGRHQIRITGTGLRSPFFIYTNIQSDTDLEIVVEGGALSGQVVDGDTGLPIVGAYVTSNPIPQLTVDAHEASRRTGRDGGFVAGPFPAGPWQFEFSAPGYAPREPVIEIGDADIDGFLVELHRTPGLRLLVSAPRGARPESARATWYDFATGETYAAPGRLVADGSSNELAWPSAPLGRGILSVITSRPTLGARIEVNNQGQLIEVPVLPTGDLYVAIEDFLADPPVYASLRLFDDEGRLVASGNNRDYYPYRHRSGDIAVRRLLPGTYRLVVTAVDGRTYTGQAEIRALEDTRLLLR